MPSTPAYRALTDAITRLQRVQREVATELARDLGCPRAALSVLWLLDKRGALGIGDMARHLHVDISVASRQVSALVDAGYAERSTPDAPGTDRRVRTVRLTEAGRDFTASTRRQFDERVAAVFGSWSLDDLMAAAGLIEKVADAVMGITGPDVAAHATSTSPAAPGQPGPPRQPAHPSPPATSTVEDAEDAEDAERELAVTAT